MVQIDEAAGAGARNLESMIRAVHADFPEAERVDEERLLIAHVAHRQHGAEEAACRDVPAHLFRRPGIALVARVLDHLEQQSGRMAHAQVLGAKPLLNAAVLGAVRLAVRLPERRRPQRDRIAGAGKLAGAGATRLARVRKCRGNGAHVGVAVPVIQVVDRDGAVHQHRLLHEALAEHLGEEVQIFLCASGTQRDVMNALHEGLHGSSSL